MKRLVQFVSILTMAVELRSMKVLVEIQAQIIKLLAILKLAIMLILMALLPLVI